MAGHVINQNPDNVWASLFGGVRLAVGVLGGVRLDRRRWLRMCLIHSASSKEQDPS